MDTCQHYHSGITTREEAASASSWRAPKKPQSVRRIEWCDYNEFMAQNEFKNLTCRGDKNRCLISPAAERES